MAESNGAIAEQQVSDAQPGLSSDDLEVTPGAELDTEDIGEDVELDEADDTEIEEPAESIDPVARFTELQGKVDAGDVLTTAEKAELRGYEQSQRDQAAARAEARRQARENQQKIAALRETLPKSIIDLVAAESEAASTEGRNMSRTLLENALKSSLNTNFNQLKPLLEFQEDATLRSYIYQQLGDTPEADELAAEDLTHLGLIRSVMQVERELGRKEASGSGAPAQVKKLQGELAAARTEIKRLGGDVAALGSGPSAVKGKPASKTGITKESVAKASSQQVAEWMSNPETNEQLAAVLRS
jgi:predicted GNAT family N-acyltransferase